MLGVGHQGSVREPEQRGKDGEGQGGVCGGEGVREE